ncbi:hypothetical protein SCUCBS95973_007325 [Sporothrix curviconia]|uniref:Uncharacterized protein n=1 Tax=Sporothrix curviconia TaxID=1260050 RepID=A0ABP0CDN8_9PEZI
MCGLFFVVATAGLAFMGIRRFHHKRHCRRQSQQCQHCQYCHEHQQQYQQQQQVYHQNYHQTGQNYQNDPNFQNYQQPYDQAPPLPRRPDIKPSSKGSKDQDMAVNRYDEEDVSPPSYYTKE